MAGGRLHTSSSRADALYHSQAPMWGSLRLALIINCDTLYGWRSYIAGVALPGIWYEISLFLVEGLNLSIII